MLGTSRGNTLKYQSHPIESLNPEHDERLMQFVVARHWKDFIRHSWYRLAPEVRTALQPIVEYRLLAEEPPPI
jgi:hypothetical protein